jgi:hypothetical protein
MSDQCPERCGNLHALPIGDPPALINQRMGMLYLSALRIRQRRTEATRRPHCSVRFQIQRSGSGRAHAAPCPARDPQSEHESEKLAEDRSGKTRESQRAQLLEERHLYRGYWTRADRSDLRRPTRESAYTVGACRDARLKISRALSPASRIQRRRT